MLPEIPEHRHFCPGDVVRNRHAGQLNDPALNAYYRLEKEGPFDPGEMIYPGQFHNQSLDGLSCSAARGSVLPNNRQRLTAVSLGPRIRRVRLDTVSLR